ncbi:lysophospholipase-like protein 1 [Haliotis asinina]|uniref:lysophospholipase-like protein 1 n=1 Tax=Haliotis asinina TaxID=109174 RepID=UPI003531F370
MAAPVIQKFKPRIVSHTGLKCTASIIFFHGSGDTGRGIEEWLGSLCGGQFNFPHIRTVFPTAPMRRCSYMGGSPMFMWFDRLAVSPDVAEHDSVHEICHEISHLIDAEVQAGIPKHRILLGGFSNGGCLSLHLGYRFHRDVAGVFNLSSFLQTESSVYKALQKDASHLPPLFQCHGKEDPLVDYKWGESTWNRLKELGVKGEFHGIEGLDHQMNIREIQMLSRWITDRVPEDGGTTAAQL